MTAEAHDVLTLLPPVPDTVTSILAAQHRREESALDEAASLRATVLRQAALLDGAEADRHAYERRIGALCVENAHIARLARQSRRDQWVTLIVAGLGLGLTIGLAVIAILAGG